jgi:hypothetical protein
MSCSQVGGGCMKMDVGVENEVEEITLPCCGRVVSTTAG